MDMVERVARAIFEQELRNHPEPYEITPLLPPPIWDDPGRLSPFGKDCYLRCARAAIEAMREPTEGMLSAGDSMMPQIAKGQDITTGYDALKDAWPAMISAALEQEGKGE